LTAKGYVIWMSIPFRSIRFHPANEQLWGVTLMRYVAHNDEYDYWRPRVSSRISGRLNQEGLITGVENVSPSHNMQFNPYGYLSSLHSVDNRDPIQPRFDNRNVQGKIGLDSKYVFHDSLVLDTTINPDFAQIESDQPQNTVNQRFEVFFPEKASSPPDTWRSTTPTFSIECSMAPHTMPRSTTTSSAANGIISSVARFHSAPSCNTTACWQIQLTAPCTPPET
jgi:hypothetical protein